MRKFSDPSSGLTLAGEPGKQSQKVHRRHRSSFWLSRTGSLPAKSRQQHIWRDPLAAVVNGITPTNSTTSGPNLTYTLIGGTSSSPKYHHQHQLLIVATIKLKQITIAIRNDLAVSVVIENSQLVIIQLDLTPIGS
jgi:hypothetical protein